MKARILIVDDEVDALDLMKELFFQHGYDVLTAQNGAVALDVLRRGDSNIDIIISDFRMPVMDGYELLEIVRREYPDIPFLMITAHATIERAVEALKKGASEYILKPLRFDEIVSKVEHYTEYRKLKKENQLLTKRLNSDYLSDKIIGRNSKMLKLFEVVRSVANTSFTVLIRGESGTGKELIAQALHNHSTRFNKVFIPVNCASIPETLIESSLYGHVKGAFTGASSYSKGFFEIADGGTLFLDEIGEVSLQIQAKLLRTIEEQEIIPIGRNKPIKVDARIIAATNRDLELAVERGEFREDLYYRLSSIELSVPPLRERVDDIPLLVSSFIKEDMLQAGDESKLEITEEAINTLQQYDWPGNVRELRNIIRRAVILRKGNLITNASFPQKILSKKRGDNNNILQEEVLEDKLSNRYMLDKQKDTGLIGKVEEFERNYIFLKMLQCEENLKETAKKLGIHYSTLRSKVEKYGLPGSEQGHKFDVSMHKFILRALIESDWDIFAAADLLGLKSSTFKAKMNNFGLSKLNSKMLVEDRRLLEVIDVYEQGLIEGALEENDFNQMKTAKQLLLNRSTLVSKIRKYEKKRSPG